MSNILILPLSSLILFQKNEQPGSAEITPLSSSVYLEYDNGGGISIKNSSPVDTESLRFSVEGNGGQLFTVNDVLTGNIFRLNDISGLPMVQVYDTGDIGIGTQEFTPLNQPIAKVHVVGDVYIQGSLSADEFFLDNLALDSLKLNSLTANEILVTSLTAISSILKVTDIQMYEMSGFDINGDVDIIGNLTVNGNISGNNLRASFNQGSATGAYSFAEGYATIASGDSSHAEGSITTASGTHSHAEGSTTTASGSNSHAEGSTTTASGGASHAEGSSTTASGDASHAEGFSTTASGSVSHAEGDSTTASGSRSHAEGYNTTASGTHSHAEGSSTIASGFASHASNVGSRAVGQGSTAMGYNAVAMQDYTYIWSDSDIGTGTDYISSTRAGQFMVSASGGMFIAGNVGIGTDDNSRALTVQGEVSTSGIINSNTGFRVNNTAAAGNVLRGNGTNFVSSVLAAADIGSGQSLTKVDDTNVTLTLGGTPASSLLKSVSLTLGWTGQLAVSRGGTGSSTGSIAGTDELKFTAGGSNKDVILIPSGSGTTKAASLSSNKANIYELYVTSLTAVSAVTEVIDIKYYELSGFNIKGDFDIDGTLSVAGKILSGGTDLLDLFPNQSLSFNSGNNNVTISNGNSVDLSKFDQNLTFNSNTGELSISDGNTVNLSILSIDLGVRELTGNWESTYSTVNSNSANWDTAYSHTSSQSLNTSDNVQFNEIVGSSANFNNVSAFKMEDYEITGKLATATTGAIALESFIEVKINNVSKYIRLYDIE